MSEEGSRLGQEEKLDQIMVSPQSWLVVCGRHWILLAQFLTSFTVADCWISSVTIFSVTTGRMAGTGCGSGAWVFHGRGTGIIKSCHPL